MNLLEAKCAGDDSSASIFVQLAEIYSKQQEDKERAVQCYRNALALDYGNVPWRLNLARLLAETGQMEDAMHEARVCLKLRPENKRAERLIAEVSVKPHLVGRKTQ